jgi:glycosyltransferase involved in cell wall biosynthesis
MASERPIRVLHCIHSLSNGGAERQLCLLAQASEAAGMECAIFCIDDSHAGTDLSGIRIIKSGQHSSQSAGVFQEIHRAIKSFKPDLIHAWLPASMTVPAMTLALYHRLPVVVSYRNEQWFRRGVYYVEFVSSLITADGIVSNTPIERSIWPYRWLYRLKKGCIIRNAVSIPTAGAETEHGPVSLPSPAEQLKLLFVGRLTKQKNWQCLLEALPHVQQHHDWRLTICGDGEDAEAVRSCIRKLALSDRVELVGFRPDVYDIMRRSHVLVLPSLYEGMPNVLMEALTLGLPCFASDIAAVRDVLAGRRCVLTFDPRSPQSLASLIDRAADNPSVLAPLALEGLKLGRSFDVQTMAHHHGEYYRSVLRRLDAAHLGKELTQNTF